MTEQEQGVAPGEIEPQGPERTPKDQARNARKRVIIGLGGLSDDIQGLG